MLQIYNNSYCICIVSTKIYHQINMIVIASFLERFTTDQ